MKNILITGGPVHAHLDAVKIITNNFKGGFMAQLATDLAWSKGTFRGSESHVTYLCSRSAKIPENFPNITVVYHEGFDDYMAKVLEMAPTMDAVILGAAVANLIPYQPIEGKFPSHNYKPGDLVPLIFKIAPRVIDEVKKVAPKTHLFGFKLLDGVDHDELIRAAYGVLLESHATAVIANDKRDLTQKYVVTKERVIHPMPHDKLADWIWEMLQDEYYQTIAVDPSKDRFEPLFFEHSLELLKKKVREFESNGGFYTTPEGYVFGTIAQRNNPVTIAQRNNAIGYRGFWTTGRGKKELDSFVQVFRVNHASRRVYTYHNKATLNVPLLDHIFVTLPEVDLIVHAHVHSKFKVPEGLPVLDYAPPGTVRDSIRPITGSFIIKDHGCFLLYDKEGVLL